MYSVGTVLGWCALSLLVGILCGFGAIMYLAKIATDYEEDDDFPDAEWVKDYEEIKQDGH